MPTVPFLPSLTPRHLDRYIERVRGAGTTSPPLPAHTDVGLLTVMPVSPILVRLSMHSLDRQHFSIVYTPKPTVQQYFAVHLVT